MLLWQCSSMHAAAGGLEPLCSLLYTPKTPASRPYRTCHAAGDEGPGKIPSDIVFVVDEKPHPTFTRDGNDLVYTHRWAGAWGPEGW